MFGRKKKLDQGPITATVDWRDIRIFSADWWNPVGVTPAMRDRCVGLTPVWATASVTALKGWGVTAFLDQDWEKDEKSGAFGLFTDPEHLRPICRLLEPETGDDGSLIYTAVDGQGATIGTITKVPPSYRRFKHTWRIRTPAGQVINGRRWIATKQAHHQSARELLNPLNYLGMALDTGSGGGGDGGPRGRHLFWVDPADDSKRAHRTHMMESTSADWCRITNLTPEQLDRRLALLAVIAEGRSLNIKPRF